MHIGGIVDTQRMNLNWTEFGHISLSNKLSYWGHCMGFEEWDKGINFRGTKAIAPEKLLIGVFTQFIE